MKRSIVSLVLSAALASPIAVFAAEIRLPARIGEPEASVRQRLGEPTSVYFDDMIGANALGYLDRGFTVVVWAQTGLVARVSVLGNHHDPTAGTYTGGVVDELDMNATLDQYVAKFGPGKAEEDFSIKGATMYRWPLDNYILRITVWDEEHAEDGVVHPKGSILSAEAFDPESEI